MEMHRPDLNPVPRSFLNSPKAKKMGAASALILTILCYQNFNFADAWKVNLIPLNEKARQAHAKELLGKLYKRSPASLVENNQTLGMAILNDVHKNLPKKYKSIAIDLSATILQESEKYEIDPVFVVAVIRTESSFNPMARGRHGEIGLMQIKPDTAKWIAEKAKIPWRGAKSLENPSINVRIGIAYLNYLRDRFDGHANKYLSAYNMGYAKVCRMYANEITPQQYSSKVMKHYNEAYRRLATATTLSLFAGN